MNPNQLIESYENLLISNLGAVRSIESGLRNVSWLLPGRFQDADIASEGLYALLNVVSGYHDSLLSKHLDPSLSLPPHPFAPPQPSSSVPKEYNSQLPTASRTAPVLPPPSDHARYTKYWTARSGLYRKASRLLVTLSYVELLVEMVAKKKLGDRRRWNFVLGIESIKTLLRLILLGITGRPVLSHPTPQREYDLLTLPSSLLRAASPASPPSGSTAGEAVPPSAAVTPSLPPFAPLRSHLFPITTALPETHLAHPTSLLPTLSPGQAVAEVIESSLTLIHVILLLRAAKQRPRGMNKHALPSLSAPLGPYAIPVFLALFSRYLRRTKSKSILLAEHNAQLDRNLAMRAFLTGPMWVGWTRPKIMGIVKTLGRIPLVGMVGDVVEGYVPLVDDYFYYSS